MQPQPDKPKQVSAEVLEAALELWRQAGDQHALPISGGSMQPLIQDGDLVRVDHRSAPIQIGDIVVFRSEAGLVAHRVLQVESTEASETRYLTMGDHNPQPDAPIRAGEVLGRVIEIQRGERRLSLEGWGWRRLNRWTAGWLRRTSAVQEGARRLGRTRGAVQPSWLSRLLRKIIRRGTWLLLMILQGSLARWQN